VVPKPVSDGDSCFRRIIAKNKIVFIHKRLLLCTLDIHIFLLM
jgi:hypothetical protein